MSTPQAETEKADTCVGGKVIFSPPSQDDGAAFIFRQPVLPRRGHNNAYALERPTPEIMTVSFGEAALPEEIRNKRGGDPPGAADKEINKVHNNKRRIVTKKCLCVRRTQEEVI